jgi:hypothetical protein
MTRSAELLQGTIDLLILKVVSLEPMHGWAMPVTNVAEEAKEQSRLELARRLPSVLPGPEP